MHKIGQLEGWVENSQAPLPKLYGDERRFLQCLINLVKNALKFTHEGTIRLKVLFDSMQSILQVRVEDTGVGIDKTDLPHLFQKFGKLHRTAEQNSTGIGLGLHIVK